MQFYVQSSSNHPLIAMQVLYTYLQYKGIGKWYSY